MTVVGRKISGLDPVSSAAGADLIAIVQAGVTKRATVSQIASGVTAGDAWGDPVDAIITPDADGTRDLGLTGTRFATAFIDALDVTNNIVVGGTVDGRDVATDGTKLDGIEIAATADQAGSDMLMARIAGSTYSNVQDMQNLFHSTGHISGGTFTDDTDGTVTIAAGTGLIRATNSAVAEIVFNDWAAEAGANVALVDEDLNYIYVEYNAGSPQVIATITKRSDLHTNIFLGTVYRNGTTLHPTEATQITVGDHAALMVLRQVETMPFAHVAGGATSEIATRKIAITAGTWWDGLTRFTTAAFNSGTGGTFSYFYQTVSGGWNEVTAQTDIDNTQYDDGSGSLATLSNNKFGVHWVYIEQSGNISVVYGTLDATLDEAIEAALPTAVPPQFEANHARLISKIDIKKSASVFTAIQLAFDTVFAASPATDHGVLAGLGDDDHTQYVTKALFDANTILAATSDDTPAALTIAASRILGRKASGNIAAMTAAELKTLVGYLTDLADDISPTLGGALAGAGNAATDIPVAINTQTGTPYVLVAGDAGKYVRMNLAGANDLTVPLNSSVAFATGTRIHVRQVGAGATTIVATGGVTISTPETLVMAKQHATATLVKTGTDAWDLMGNLTTV